MRYGRTYNWVISLRLICVALLMGWVCYACRKQEDDSSGSVAMKGVLISGLDSVYTVKPETPLKLESKVSFTSGNPADSSRYRYEWFKLWMVGYLNYDDYTIIGTARRLRYQEPIQGGYDLVFRVTDLQTNLFTEKQVRVFVANAVYEGWVLLGERNSQAQLDMLSYQPTTGQYKRIKNVLNWSHSQGSIQGKPFFIDFTIGSFFNTGLGGLVLGTNQRILVYSGEDLNLIGAFQDYLPIKKPVNFTNINYDGRLYTAFFNVDGELFVTPDRQASAVSSYKRINQLLHLDGTVRVIKTAPWIAVAKGFPAQQTTVLFDETAKELLWFNPENAYCNQFGTGKLFSFKTGKNLLYLGYTEKEGGQYVALLQTPDTKAVYLARFSLNSQLYYEKVAAPMIEKAVQFSLHPAEGTVFYSVGSELYAIDEIAKEGRLLMRFDGNLISKIKFSSFLSIIPRSHLYTGTTASEKRYRALQNQLIVCTYDPLSPDASGTFMLFDTDLHQWKLQERFRQEGFAKIIDVAYKER